MDSATARNTRPPAPPQQGVLAELRDSLLLLGLSLGVTVGVAAAAQAALALLG